MRVRRGGDTRGKEVPSSDISERNSCTCFDLNSPKQKISKLQGIFRELIGRMLNVEC